MPGGPSALASFLGSGACVFDYNGDGKPDIFLVNADGKGSSALYRNTGDGKFVNETKAAKLDFHGQGTGCAVGDYDNDGHPDLAISFNGGIALYQNEGDGTFKDVTSAAGIQVDGLVLGITFIDYDQDGDLDLYLTRFEDFPLKNSKEPFSFPQGAGGPGNILLRNKGNGTFMDITQETGLRGAGPSIGAISSDINNDQSVDLVVSGWQKLPTIFINQREGAFRQRRLGGAMPGPTAGLAASDFDRDGWMDLAFTHWAAPALTLWRNIGGKSFQPVSLPDPGWMRGWGVAPLDYDNDGWIDLIAVGENFSGEGRIALLRNEGPHGFRDVTAETGLDKIMLRNPRSVIAFDFTGDGSMDLLITQNHLPPKLLKNVGGAKNGWMQLVFQGSTDSKSGIGVNGQMFIDAEQQHWEVPGASGYLGQGPSEVHLGLASNSGADVLRVVWPTGVLQDEIQVLGEKRDLIPEYDSRDFQH